MRKDTQRGDIQLPNDICRCVVFEEFFAIWTIILTIDEALRVETT